MCIIYFGCHTFLYYTFEYQTLNYLRISSHTENKDDITKFMIFIPPGNIYDVKKWENINCFKWKNKQRNFKHVFGKHIAKNAYTSRRHMTTHMKVACTHVHTIMKYFFLIWEPPLPPSMRTFFTHFWSISIDNVSGVFK